MEAKNPQWANAEQTRIDLLVMHPAFGEIPFTADPQDVEAHGRELFARAIAGEFGEVAAYVPPPEPPIVQNTPEPTEGNGEAV